MPGLVPTAQQIAAEEGCLQRDKDGLEIDQGLFLSAMLEQPRSGRHLCHAMLLPRPEAQALLPRFEREGIVELNGASVRRRARRQSSPRAIRAFSMRRIRPPSTPLRFASISRCSIRKSEIAVMRGAPVEHPKYKGRRVFGAGINLTHLYHGRIPFVWYLQRDLGWVNKIYRGLAFPDDAPPDEFGGQTIEKPWIAAVEAFAIGGHCQALLVMDYVLAARDAFLTLPARKEGIIPGAANMRMPRFTGDRIARQAIQYERRLDCDSPEGRLICDEIVEPGDMDAAIERVVAGLTNSGVVSAAGNRRAFRVDAGAVRHVPLVFCGLRARAGLLPFQPGLDLESRALLERAEPQALIEPRRVQEGKARAQFYQVGKIVRARARSRQEDDFARHAWERHLEDRK